MKNIVQHIKKSYYDNIYLSSMKDYFGEYLPNSVYESINNEDYEDHILENLKSHDIKLLCKKIKETFEKDNMISILDVNNKNTSVEIVSYKELDKDTLKRLLDFFGYYVTKSFKEDTYHYIISPVYTNNANNLVYVKNHGKLYHFSTGKFAKEIEKTGLRCRSAKYRNYPERIYVYASCKNLEQIPNLYDKANLVINPFDAKKYGIYVYRIDLNDATNDTYINFYEDDTMNEKDTVYTYNSIPVECIKLVKILK